MDDSSYKIAFDKIPLRSYSEQLDNSFSLIYLKEIETIFNNQKG